MRDRSKGLVTTPLFAGGWQRTAGASLAPLGLVLALGCEPAQAAGPAPTVSLRVRGAPADATVVIDDNAIGTFDFVAAHGVALPPGVHRITVAASGYFPWDRAIEAKAGSPPIRLDVTLQPVPD